MEFLNASLGQLPLIGLGTFSISHTILEDLIPVALDLGYTLFDTAYKYQNESVLGRILQESGRDRSDYFLETKVCAEQLLGNLRFLRLNARTLNYCFQSAIQKLRTDYINIGMLHSTFHDYEKFFVQLLDLKQAGRINSVGICNITLEQLKAMYDIVGHYPDVVQCEVHPYFSNRELISFCQEQGIVVEARSPLAHGDALEEWGNEAIFNDLCNKYKKSVSQIVLRWITQQGVIALPRTSNLKHLKDNINIFDILLTEEEMQSLDNLNRNQSYGFFSRKVKY